MRGGVCQLDPAKSCITSQKILPIVLVSRWGSLSKIRELKIYRVRLPHGIRSSTNLHMRVLLVLLLSINIGNSCTAAQRY